MRSYGTLRLMLNYFLPGTILFSLFFSNASFSMPSAGIIADHIRNRCDEALLVSARGCLTEVREEIRLFKAEIQVASLAASPRQNRSAVSLSKVQGALFRLKSFSTWIGSDAVLKDAFKETLIDISTLNRRLMNWDETDQKEISKDFSKMKAQLKALSDELGV